MTDLRKAAQDLLNRYVDLVNFGDCGYSNPEQEKEVIALRQALEQPEQEREWVGLTDGDLPDNAPYEFTAVVRWAEAKLKEKNT